MGHGDFPKLGEPGWFVIKKTARGFAITTVIAISGFIGIDWWIRNKYQPVAEKFYQERARLYPTERKYHLKVRSVREFNGNEVEY